MRQYVQTYLGVLKKDFMLVMMAVVLISLTFGYWYGIPIFLVGDMVGNITNNLVILHLCVSLSGGLLLSFYLLPINVRVAKNIANKQLNNTFHTFIRIQISWILVYAVLFEIIILRFIFI
ncbi:hypothetical protein [Ornithinibacillus scapharcae]|uniref:hypothetical protein n=1 Tax=Ornithinibacillus scapharcae TaxID=1147159 RepID=UPI000225B087|nr:hypothetical protein [Ornithinibacillus scapharcae]